MGTGTRLGTMGPLTCAAEALDVYARRGRRPLEDVTFFPCFEEARDALLTRKIDVAIMPHCHPLATELLFDVRFAFDMASAFDKPNPPLYLATRKDGAEGARRPAACAAVPLTWPLVSDEADIATGNPALQLLPVPSNPAAARAVTDHRADLAITNRPSLLAYDLAPLRTLKHVVLRWFPVRLSAAGAALHDAAYLPGAGALSDAS